MKNKVCYGTDLQKNKYKMIKPLNLHSSIMDL